MLVALVYAVARKMLDRIEHLLFFTGTNVFTRTADDRLRVAAVRPDIGDRISPVQINVDDRREGEIAAYCLAFRCADLSEFIGKMRIAGCSDLHLLSV